jgi:hypothetical protein
VEQANESMAVEEMTTSVEFIRGKKMDVSGFKVSAM